MSCHLGMPDITVQGEIQLLDQLMETLQPSQRVAPINVGGDYLLIHGCHIL